MKARILLFTLTTLISLTIFGRLVKIIDPKTLIADSKLVFVGKVQSVKVSGISTPLSYPTWEGASFPWLRVEMEVLVPFKGLRKGDIVRVMLLAIDTSKEFRFMYSPPEVLEPDKGNVFFLCLGPTPITNTFTAFTAPYNENLSVFPLYRIHAKSMGSDGKQLHLNDQRFAPIWRLVDQAGEILPDGVTKLRKIYAAEIRKAPAKEMVYLEWQAYTNTHGWVTDVPKGFSPTNSDVKK